MDAKFAYFLGWMYSDGSIIKDKRCNSYTVQIKILKSDEKTLQLFSDITDWSFSYERDKYVCMRKTDKLFGKYLISLGVLPRKSFENCLLLKRPAEISDSYMPYFIRGYFDGNGSYSWISKETYMLSCNCYGKCYNLLNDYKQFLSSKDIKSTLDESKNGFYQLRIRTREDVKRFVNLIFSDRLDLILERKYLKVKEYLANYHTTRELQSIAGKKHVSPFANAEIHNKAMQTRKKNILLGISKPSMLGKHHSEETKKKISIANKKAHLVHDK